MAGDWMIPRAKNEVTAELDNVSRLRYMGHSLTSPLYYEIGYSYTA